MFRVEWTLSMTNRRRQKRGGCPKRDLSTISARILPRIGREAYSPSSNKSIGDHHAVSAASTAFAFTPHVYINKTDTGGEWRTMAEASLSAEIVADSADARPSIGFTSVDGKQSIYVTLDTADHVLQAFQHLKDGSTVAIRNHPKVPNDPRRTFSIETGKPYRLQLDWSPYSNALIVFLFDLDGKQITQFSHGD